VLGHNICPSRKGADTNSQLFALRTRQFLRKVILISTQAQVTQDKNGAADQVATKVTSGTDKPMVYSRRPKKKDLSGRLVRQERKREGNNVFC